MSCPKPHRAHLSKHLVIAQKFETCPFLFHLLCSVKVTLSIWVFGANRSNPVERGGVSLVKNLLAASLLRVVIRPPIDLEVQMLRIRVTKMFKFPLRNWTDLDRLPKSQRLRKSDFTGLLFKTKMVLLNWDRPTHPSGFVESVEDLSHAQNLFRRHGRWGAFTNGTMKRLKLP